MKKLKNNKATGIDGIAGEMIKYGGRTMSEEMIKIYQKIWREESIPDEWHEGIYVPLHKKGDRYDCQNYRGLCLLTIGYNFLSTILCKKLLPYYLGIIGEYKAGFIPGKATIDNIFILRQLNEKYREFRKTSWHVFVDYRQAYDSVHRPSLWLILRLFGLPAKLIRIIKVCYENSSGRVRVGGSLTDAFDVVTGLRQGCPLSCILFNFSLEWAMRNTPPSQDRLTFTNGLQCDRLAYADDADLCGERFEGRDEQIELFNEVGERVGPELG